MEGASTGWLSLCGAQEYDGTEARKSVCSERQALCSLSHCPSPGKGVFNARQGRPQGWEDWEQMLGAQLLESQVELESKLLLAL